MSRIDIPDPAFSSHHKVLWGSDMPAKKRAVRSRTRSTGTLAALRRRAEAMMGRLRRAGMQQVRAIERQIEKLNRQRADLMAEIGLSGASGASGARRGRGGGRGR